MPAVILSTPGKRYVFRQIEFWAERGMVHYLDLRQDPPEETVSTVRDCLERVRALNAGLHRVEDRYPGERLELERFIEEAVRCCKEAQSQGDPGDPRTLAWVNSRRNKRILYPGSGLSILPSSPATSSLSVLGQNAPQGGGPTQ